ncbi:MAG: hypothetical protein NDF54_02410 [archaeon GB-1867-035]|nr:hypothetical protein [Candidatus Culexmicrobium profundum]
MRKPLALYVVAGISLGFIVIFAPIFIASYQLAGMEKSSREAYPVVVDQPAKMTSFQDFKAFTQFSESRLGIRSAQPYDYVNLMLMVTASLFSAFVISFTFKRKLMG